MYKALAENSHLGLYNSELPIKDRNIYRLMDKTCAVQNDPGQCMIILDHESRQKIGRYSLLSG